MSAALDVFRDRFSLISGNQPFPWQEALFELLLRGDVPSRCDIPTGLGKTSIITIWLLALAQCSEYGQPRRLPRRLAYVVNRRTVVDQATREAEVVCKRLMDAKLAPLNGQLRSLGIQGQRGGAVLDAPVAVSTLRGAFADNAAWRMDPARPAIILGTVDMIGSRLLFSAYGRGFKARPLHAGFLGQDTLIVHDEAHLEPAFQDLLTDIEAEQDRGAGSQRDAFGRVLLMALTATPRGNDEGTTRRRQVFQLTAADWKEERVTRRTHAAKGIDFHAVEEKKLVDRVAELALAHEDGGEAILVFLRKVDDIYKLTKRLRGQAYRMLTGTIRGQEREGLRNDPVFARFDPKSAVDASDVARGTVYLVCTSAGEVGVDISADHLVCDLTPFDSMAQRFGRVNRFGQGRARVDVVHAIDEAARAADAKEDQRPYEQARARTLDLLKSLPRHAEGRLDASPAALGALPQKERTAAFSPLPDILPVTSILFDSWALTSITDRAPGRPPVSDWLHGVAAWEPPQTSVAWRKEVEHGRVPDTIDPGVVLDLYPLKPHELLSDSTRRVFRELDELARRAGGAPVWVVDPDGTVVRCRLVDVAARGEAAIEDKTVLLPPSAGALEEQGTLRADAPPRKEDDYDVADLWLDPKGKPRRRRVRVEVDASAERPAELADMRLVLTLPCDAHADEDDDEPAETRVWRWYVAPLSVDDPGSRTAPSQQSLSFHLAEAESFAREIVRALGLDEPEAAALVWAARFHDLGKERRLWQRSIGNFEPTVTLAKSRERRGRRSPTKYRHELGSLFDVEQEAGFRELSDDAKELARHVIAAHHGRARPHFPDDEVFDPAHSDAACRVLAREVPLRFARLQRRYGRWGLAYLESLLRAADALASLMIEGTSETAPANEEAAE